MIFHFIFRLYEIKETKLNVKLCEKSVKRKQKIIKKRRKNLNLLFRYSVCQKEMSNLNLKCNNLSFIVRYDKFW